MCGFRCLNIDGKGGSLDLSSISSVKDASQNERTKICKEFDGTNCGTCWNYDGDIVVDDVRCIPYGLARCNKAQNVQGPNVQHASVIDDV